MTVNELAEDFKSFVNELQISRDDYKGIMGYIDDGIVLLKEHGVMSPDEFKNGLLKMFSSIWDCEVDHPIFQDTVGDLMSAVMQLYARAVKWDEWVSVSDRLPEEKQSRIPHDFEYVICATTFGDVRAYKFGTPIGWNKPHFWDGCGIMDEYITHWMPMPEMPVVT